jgi:hypothetical protein
MIVKCGQHISLHSVIHKPVAVVNEQKEMCTLKKHAVVLLQ